MKGIPGQAIGLGQDVYTKGHRLGHRVGKMLAKKRAGCRQVCAARHHDERVPYSNIRVYHGQQGPAGIEYSGDVQELPGRTQQLGGTDILDVGQVGRSMEAGELRLRQRVHQGIGVLNQ